MARKWIVAGVVIAICVLAILLWPRKSPFDHAEEIVENFYIAYEIENIPQGEIQKAKALYWEALREDPLRWEAYDRLVFLYCVQNRYGEAEKVRDLALSRGAPLDQLRDMDTTIKLYKERDKPFPRTTKGRSDPPGLQPSTRPPG